jgi:AP-1 complex subunit beta-1
MEKLEVMIRLASDKNIDQVLLELKEYAQEVDVDFVRKVGWGDGVWVGERRWMYEESCNHSRRLCVFALHDEWFDAATPTAIAPPPQAVRAIGRCAVSLESAAERCINVLLELIRSKVNYVVQEAVIVIKVGALG